MCTFSLISDIILHLLVIVFSVVLVTLLGIIILFMFMWDCLIFIIKRLGELLWLKKKK